jgi:hypothetical protein
METFFIADHAHVGNVLTTWVGFVHPVIREARQLVVRLLDVFEGRVNKADEMNPIFLAQEVSNRVEYARNSFFTNVLVNVHAHLSPFEPIGRRKDFLKTSCRFVKTLDDLLDNIRPFLNDRILDEDDDDPVNSPSFSFTEVKDLIDVVTSYTNNFYVFGQMLEKEEN